MSRKTTPRAVAAAGAGAVVGAVAAAGTGAGAGVGSGMTGAAALVRSGVTAAAVFSGVPQSSQKRDSGAADLPQAPQKTGTADMDILLVIEFLEWKLGLFSGTPASRWRRRVAAVRPCRL
ncbi:hypothetical protein F8197_11040 [Duganella sp. FT27W]|nr:hypothetical protein [Duganella sp. FT27W]